MSKARILVVDDEPAVLKVLVTRLQLAGARQIECTINGLVFGLFLGLILDSLTLDNNFTQIPGLIFCGFLFGKIKLNTDILVGHFRHGLICSFGSFLCGTLHLSQILFKNFSDSNSLMFISGIKNILAEVFLTGLLAPFVCSQLLRMFKFSRIKLH